MFIGREHEIETLNGLYHSEGFQYAVIYGRRGVGKTALINEFSKGKPVIYFMGMDSSRQQNVDNLYRSVLAYVGDERRPSPFNGLEDGLNLIFQLAEEKRIVFVVDGVSYAAKAFGDLFPTLRRLIDENREKSRLMLILCSSSMIFAEKQLFGSRSVLRDCEAARILVPPFDFEETGKLFRKFNDVDLACIYGVTGGVAEYLEKIDENLSVEANIKKCFLHSGGILYGAADSFLRQEVREPGVYNAILSAVAGGCTRLSEIASEIGEETSATATYMRSLIAAGLIRKEFPCGETGSRRTFYRITDELMAFWYRFIPTRLNWIQQGYTDGVYGDMLPEFQHYMEEVFEKICIQYIRRLQKAGRVKTACGEIGRWWGPHPETKEETVIPIMGTDGKSCALFGDCRWTEEKVDVDVLKELEEKSRIFAYPEKEYFMFAKKGFTRRCIDRANAMGAVTLVAFV